MKNIMAKIEFHESQKMTEGEQTVIDDAFRDRFEEN